MSFRLIRRALSEFDALDAAIFDAARVSTPQSCQLIVSAPRDR
jgi:hypothetical protein